MTDNLMNMARILQTMFFAEGDVTLVKQREELQRMEHTKKVLSGLSGITNQDILQKFIELDVSPEAVTSLALVPLVMIAWADGEVDDKEREAVLNSLRGYGLIKNNVNYTLLNEWLGKRPPRKMLDAWTHYISEICGSLSAEERAELKANIMGHAAAVAGASGGFLSITKISPEEEGMLAKLKKAFD